MNDDAFDPVNQTLTFLFLTKGKQFFFRPKTIIILLKKQQKKPKKTKKTFNIIILNLRI